MNSLPPDPALTPEERDLAQRLSRLGGTREPSPALDARILAAAHDAVQASASASASKRRRAHRRWPVGLGVAASLALALGIGWQLRPLPEATVEYSEAPAAAQDAATTANTSETSATSQSAAGTVEQARVEPRRQAVQPPEFVSAPTPQPEAPAKRKASPQPARDDAASDEAGFAPSPEEPSIVFDDPSPVGTPAPVPPAPAAPPAPPPSPAEPRLPTASPLSGAAAGASKQEEADHEIKKQRARSAASQRDSSAAAEAEAASASALDRSEATGSRVGYDDDQPLDERPPASADSPQVQQAWLQRIRELVARGQVDEARASLAEYRRRYPGQPLPDDLRALDE